MAAFVGAGESVADIGADHGYLPLYLVREGISPFAILTDVQPGPLEKTRLSAARAGVFEGDARFDFRLGDGLAALKSAEADVVVIAGMGGETIAAILESGKAKARSFKKYILQPRTKTGIVKEWLESEGWTILAETAAEERGRLCDIIVCSPGDKQ